MADTQPPISRTPDPTPAKPTAPPPPVYSFACGSLILRATRLQPRHWDVRVLRPLDDQGEVEELVAVVAGLAPPVGAGATPEQQAHALCLQVLDRCSAGAYRCRRDQFWAAVGSGRDAATRRWTVEPIFVESYPAAPDLAPPVVVAPVAQEGARQAPLVTVDGLPSAFDRSLGRDKDRPAQGGKGKGRR
jgi:hypothetical protein